MRRDTLIASVVALGLIVTTTVLLIRGDPEPTPPAPIPFPPVRGFPPDPGGDPVVPGNSTLESPRQSPSLRAEVPGPPAPVEVPNSLVLGGTVVDASDDLVRESCRVQYSVHGEEEGKPRRFLTARVKDGRFETREGGALDSAATYDLVVEIDGGWKGEVLEDVAPGRADLVLRVPGGGTISGRVFDIEGAPVGPGYRVRAWAPANHGVPGRTGEARTLSDGSYEIRFLGDSKFSVTAVGGDGVHATGGKRLGVLPGTRDAEFSGIRLLTSFSGRFLDERGTPLRATAVTVREGGLDPVVIIDGEFVTIEGLDPGAFWVDVLVEKVLYKSRRVYAPGDRADVTVRRVGK